VKFLIKLPGNN